MWRGVLLWRAFPQVVPGVSFRESFLGQAALELSHFENLPRTLPVVGAGAHRGGRDQLGELILASLRLRGLLRLGERLALGFGLGTAGLGVITLLLGRAGLLSPWLFRLGLALIAAAGLRVSRIWEMERPRFEARTLIPVALIAPFLVRSCF